MDKEQLASLLEDEASDCRETSKKAVDPQVQQVFHCMSIMLDNLAQRINKTPIWE